MIVLYLKEWGLLDVLKQETAKYSRVWFEGFQDVSGRNFSDMNDWVEYMLFTEDDDALMFILEYGDKYRPERSEYAFKGGIKPF